MKKANPNSILAFPDDYVVIDVETTGRSPEWDSIIELSAIQYKNLEEIATFSTLINPKCEIEDFITELTSITNEMVANAPIIEDVIEEYTNFIGNNIVVGHNVSFDIRFIRQCAPSFNPQYIDTLRLARLLHRDRRHNRLCDLTEIYGLSDDGLHRAEYDCRTTNNILNIFRSEYLEEFGCLDKVKQNIYARNYYPNRLCKAAEIITSNTNFDSSNPFFEKIVVFTGTLEKMTRKEAMQHVVDIGGLVADGVTKKTNYLVLGNNDYCKSIKDGKSTKQKKAEKLILGGQDLEIIPENVFYDLIKGE